MSVNVVNHILPLWVTVHGRIAPIASIIVYLSPLPTIQKICIDRSVKSLPLLPYSTMIISSYLWFIYGILKNDVSIYISNCIGLVLGLYYFISYQKHSPSVSSIIPGSLQQHNTIVFTCVCIATSIALLLPNSTTNSISSFIPISKTELIGKIGVLFCIGLFASPLVTIQTVIVTKSARSIPLPFTIASTINCYLWSIYGLYETYDSNVYVPNLLGLSFCCIQILLKLYYYTNDSITNNDGTSTTIIDKKRDEIRMLQTDSAV